MNITVHHIANDYKYVYVQGNKKNVRNLGIQFSFTFIDFDELQREVPKMKLELDKKTKQLNLKNIMITDYVSSVFWSHKDVTISVYIDIEKYKIQSESVENIGFQG